MTATLVIFSDGGSRGNGSESAQAYGSLLARLGTQEQRVRREYGLGTNNEAEMRTVANALALARKYAQAGLCTEVEIRVDSTLVEGLVFGTFKTKKANLRPILEEAQRQKVALEALVPIRVVRISGDEMKAVLGH